MLGKSAEIQTGTFYSFPRGRNSQGNLPVRCRALFVLTEDDE